MVEIAICLAVIGFALVAIIGILPTGMQVQRDNREDTIINQDGTYFMEAIRSGAQGLNELTNYVEEIIHTNLTAQTVDRFANFTSGREIIGLLSYPGDEDIEVRAIVRAISGSAAEKPPAATDVAFRYQLRVQNKTFRTASPEFDDEVLKSLKSNIRELRLEFRWPVLPNGSTGSGRQVFRALVNGELVPDPPPSVWHFFHPR